MPVNKRRDKLSEDPLCNSDFELYQPSATEEEEYSGDDLTWEVEKVHGMEVDLQRKKRYEVEWKEWQRSDGSSTTWEYLHGDDSAAVRTAWETNMDKRNKERAGAGGLISIHAIQSHLPHNVHTAEAYEAYGAKLKSWGKKQAENCDWDYQIEHKRNRQLHKSTTRAPSESSGSSSRKRKRESSMSSNGSRMSTSTFAGPSSQQIKRESSILSTDAVAASPTSVREKLRSTRVSRFRENPSTRSPRDIHTLARSWTRAASAVGAEEIEVINEEDDEEGPQLSDDFKYLERACRYGDGVKHPSESDSFMCGCSCTDNCSGLLSCDCQSNAEIRNEDGELQRAYDNEGRFLFNNYGAEVIECNEKCSCSPRCKNRVAQKPRDIPLQIFKTASNGWGVRCRHEIAKGKVLGIYTGEIITREAADQISPREHTYLFNLDTRDADENLDFYTVDATCCGNWTRFINHSCNPNASVYSVVYDNILENNMPYLAVVAGQDIAPGVEITFDYNPAGSRSLAASQDKKNDRRVPCKCESKNCRGWLF